MRAAKSITPSQRDGLGTYRCVGHPDCAGHERANDVAAPCQCCLPRRTSRTRTRKTGELVTVHTLMGHEPGIVISAAGSGRYAAYRIAFEDGTTSRWPADQVSDR